MTTSEPLHELEVLVRTRLRGRVQELRIELVDGMIVLYGRTESYYGKQVAQELVKSNTHVPIRENCLVVDRADSGP